MVYPSTPSEAKALFLAAIEDPNPVLFFEHKALYRRGRETIAAGYASMPFGQARIRRRGEDLTIISYGLGVVWAEEALANLPHLSATLVDLRTLAPWDRETVFRACRETGKVLVLHEDTRSGGFGAEIAAEIGEQCFEYLDAPIMRCGSEELPVPFSKTLERGFLANSKLEKKLTALHRY